MDLDTMLADLFKDEPDDDLVVLSDGFGFILLGSCCATHAGYTTMDNPNKCMLPGVNSSY